ncbi:MAG TPA: hypothetical protein VL974_13655 [Magnetospirillum sp.]|jgi:hypothetical protein|nr:hypothetical protein [Magnetospirillum sp.]
MLPERTSSFRPLPMLKHLPSAIFFVCLTAIVINVTLYDYTELYLGAVVVGTLAMVVQWLMERSESKKTEPARDEQIAHWRAQHAHVSTRLEEARRTGTEHLQFLENQLAEAERQLKKLKVTPV